MLKVIIILILVYFGLKILFKYIFPAMVGSFIAKKMAEMQRQQQAYQSQKRDSEVSFGQSNNQKKKFSKDTGEYVEFEEIK